MNLEGNKGKVIEKLNKSEGNYIESREEGFIKNYKTEIQILKDD